MRLPYVPDPPPNTTPDEAAIVERIRVRRAPRPLTVLDRALLHSPAVADGWNTFMGAIRTRTSLPADIRELAISRVAAINCAWYEWKHHAPLAVAPGGVALEVVRGPAVADGTRPLRIGDEDAELRRGLDDRQWAALVYADEMTRNVRVSDETFARLRELFSVKEIVELTATISSYNGVSRFLVALDIGEMNDSEQDLSLSH
ncbi:hypothetical protein VTK73DRAFT_5094 [Phialemonium thermophilum]|uniref:Carboxymuconolactone decarboxylase-like domain-containing protein n=1 Tax=Phialemonium thermophilum TaxID=223376 RepID=A0ABR3WQ18_9PEZI